MPEERLTAEDVLIRDLLYTVRCMLQDKGCKAPWAEILERHLARIDGGDGGGSMGE